MLSDEGFTGCDFDIAKISCQFIQGELAFGGTIAMAFVTMLFKKNAIDIPGDLRTNRRPSDDGKETDNACKARHDEPGHFLGFNWLR